MRYGASRSPKAARYHPLIDTFLSRVAAAPFDAAAALSFGRARAALAASGPPIGPLDTLIASHALALGAILVTNNLREFERVPGLQVEDWTV